MPQRAHVGHSEVIQPDRFQSTSRTYEGGHPETAEPYRERPGRKMPGIGRRSGAGALSIGPFEGSRWRLRWTRQLMGFASAPRVRLVANWPPSGSLQGLTAWSAGHSACAGNSLRGAWPSLWRTFSLRNTLRVSAPLRARHGPVVSWSHEVSATALREDSRARSSVVSLSTRIIGPPQSGHGRISPSLGADVAGTRVSGCEDCSSNRRHSGSN